MNNGKVRIYELSKELNLDNKELLAICDQLNIAVKSHSSTITESDAERIRAAAEKLAATTHVTPKQDRSSHSHKPNPSDGSHNQTDAAHKQQILEIRKPKIQLKDSTTQASEASKITNKQFSSSETSHPAPPRPFAPSAPSMKPTAPTRNTSREKSQNSQKTEDQTLNQETQTATPESAPPSKPKLEKPQKPQLVAPQSRQPAQQPAKTGQGSVSARPILKRDRPKPKTNSGATSGDTSVTPSPKSSRPTPSTKPEQKGPKSGGETSKPRIPRSAPPGIAAASPIATPPKAISLKVGDTEEDADDEVMDTDAEVIELKRPTPPRLPKLGKKRHKEEEIEEIKDAGKSGKGAVKGKRVKPIVVEEDFEEDLLDEDEDLDGDDTVQISSAIVRPPKPKTAKPSQPVTTKTPAAPVTRGKKSSSFSRESKGRREAEPKRERPSKLVITSTMTVQELADALAIADTEIVKILFIKGMAVSITQNLDIPTITLVAQELEIEIETQEPEAEARKVTEMIDVEDLENLHRRPPVVTIMGHVDHGKTTLLDSIRKTKVASGEAGGITQHIGAYHVDIEHDGKTQQIVFLDTPGHEAFTAMRARGARVTDIAILVVAADDGVRPQTIEAISHAQAAGVPIVVAINKIDKEGAQPDRVKQELTQYGLTPEEWGGETIMVPVSAIQGENLDTLLEMILLVAEVEELSANPNRPAKGTVIEAHLDKAKGAVATLLIQNGSLRVGDMLVAGPVFGKVRAMVDDRGARVEAAYPSFAVEVLGLSDVPAAGDEFDVFQSDKEARGLAAKRTEKQRLSRLLQGGRVTLTSISAQAQEGDLKELNLILKADVQGSIEAIVGSLKQIPQNEVQIRLLLSSAGEITQTDIDLAAASGAVIIGFNTTYASGARQAADEAGVDVREYNIIYKLLEDIQGALEGLLEPELVEEPLGQAEVRAVFAVGKGAVAGCYVQSGKLLRNCKVRVVRGGKVINENALDSLKRMKDDVKEVNSGYECGVGIDKYTDWEEGDIIEAFQMVTKRRTLSMTK
ncbi:translation initiation factor IF-2 [Calothrix rhizosoleniae]|uniref:translation initiation factor IF-2 n=1 Tax=Calothrix rhizosoleniae TaxID=888997 RepID=UPI000B49B9EA|nr:translation initiation factor IF-2 [Calothrix rhizosoleniae]